MRLRCRRNGRARRSWDLARRRSRRGRGMNVRVPARSDDLEALTAANGPPRRRIPYRHAWGWFRRFRLAGPGLETALTQAEELMRLDAQAPFRMGETIGDRCVDILRGLARALVHWLKQEMREVEAF